MRFIHKYLIGLGLFLSINHGFGTMNSVEEMEILETKIGTLLSLKFKYKGEELLERTQEYLNKELLVDDEDLSKALDMHLSKQEPEDFLTRTSIHIPIRLYEGLSVKNSLLGAASYPLEETLDLLDFKRVFHLSNDEYNSIDGYSLDIFDQKYRVYERYKYPEVFLLESLDFDSLKQYLCVRHPFVELRERMIEKNDLYPYQGFLFNVFDFIKKEDLTTYLNHPYKSRSESTTIQRYFEVIKYIDPAYFSKVQDFKNDPLYSMEHHDPYFCKSCIPHGFVFDNLSEVGGPETRRDYLKEYGPYFSKELPRDITETEFLAHIKGKNPYFPS